MNDATEVTDTIQQGSYSLMQVVWILTPTLQYPELKGRSAPGGSSEIKPLLASTISRSEVVC